MRAIQSRPNIRVPSRIRLFSRVKQLVPSRFRGMNPVPFVSRPGPGAFDPVLMFVSRVSRPACVSSGRSDRTNSDHSAAPRAGR
jgi:hypothetical protein